MKVRTLNLKDAPFMLEWMHDKTIVQYMEKDFSQMQLKDCEQFIKNSQNFQKHMHLAIVDENDTYMGTVSLKNIDKETLSAEFAITIRKCAMGRNYAKYGMGEIIQKGFHDLGLETIYWYVSSMNERAIRFYNKNGYPYMKDISKVKLSKDDLIWYKLKKEDFL